MQYNQAYVHTDHHTNMPPFLNKLFHPMQLCPSNFMAKVLGKPT